MECLCAPRRCANIYLGQVICLATLALRVCRDDRPCGCAIGVELMTCST